MLFLFLIGVCLIWAIIAYMLHISSKFNRKYIEGYLASLVFGCIFVLVAGIVSIDGINDQRYDYENLTAINEKIQIYNDKTIDLTNQFYTVLQLNYPNHEKQIFDNITPENMKLIFIKYPELKASTTAIKFVDEIASLNNQLYRTKIDRVDIIRELKFRPKNLIYIGAWIPKYEINY